MTRYRHPLTGRVYTLLGESRTREGFLALRDDRGNISHVKPDYLEYLERVEMSIPKRPWRASDKDPQCIVSDDFETTLDHPVSKSPMDQEMEWYGGRFICESVAGELRDFIVRAVNAYEGK